MDAVFGEDYEVHLRVGFPRFLDERADMFGGVGEVGGVLDGEELGLAEADDDGVWEGLVEASEAGHFEERKLKYCFVVLFCFVSYLGVVYRPCGANGTALQGRLSRRGYFTLGGERLLEEIDACQTIEMHVLKEDSGA